MAREAWKSVDVATVNGNIVRLRTMQKFTARWHSHAESDELFYVLSGLFHLDTDDRTVDVRAGELFVVPAGVRHRGRAGAQTTLLVVDCLPIHSPPPSSGEVARRAGGGKPHRGFLKDYDLKSAGTLTAAFPLRPV